MNRVIAWNARVGRKPRRVARSVKRMARWHKVDVFVLLEASTYADALREKMPDWHIFGQSTDALVLIRRGSEFTMDVIQHDVAWRGPKLHIDHTGRRWPIIDFGTWQLACLHRVPGGPMGGTTLDGFNKRAWGQEAVLLRTTARAATVPTLFVGDQNATVMQMMAWVREAGGRVVRTGLKVDWAWLVGKAQVTAKALGRHGSDHHAVLYVVTLP